MISVILQAEGCGNSTVFPSLLLHRWDTRSQSNIIQLRRQYCKEDQETNHSSCLTVAGITHENNLLTDFTSSFQKTNTFFHVFSPKNVSPEEFSFASPSSEHRSWSATACSPGLPSAAPAQRCSAGCSPAGCPWCSGARRANPAAPAAPAAAVCAVFLDRLTPHWWPSCSGDFCCSTQTAWSFWTPQSLCCSRSTW